MSAFLISYTKHDSFFHRLDPLSKLVWMAGVLTMSLVSQHAMGQIALLAAVLCCVRFGARISARHVGIVVSAVLWMCATFFVVQAVLADGETAVARLGSVIITREGLDHAATVAVRQIILVAVGLAFVATTDPYDLEIVLNRTLRLKYQYAFLMSVTLVLLPVFEREVEHLRQIEQLRNPSRRPGSLAGIRQLCAIAPALVSRGVRRSLTLALSIESRAFSTRVQRTYPKTITATPPGRLLMAGTAAATLAWCVAAATLRM